MPELKKIILYPVKSLEGIEVNEAVITEKGALKFDRAFALKDAEGKFINAKKYPSILLIRASFNLDEMYIMLSVKGNSEQLYFSLINQQNELEKWFSNYFEKEVKLCQNKRSGFPDDTEAYGPTVVSLASIKEVASWFKLDSDEIIKRFRPNLIVDDTPPFWEDGLFGEAGEKKYFTIGNVTFAGVNPCNRCIVPSRNQKDSSPYPDFQNIFMEMREKTLPEWACKNRFNHFYKFCLNTETPLAETGKTVKIGDKVLTNN